MRGMGLKQMAMLEIFKEKKVCDANEFRYLYPNSRIILSSLETLKLNGFIRFIGNGKWEYIEERENENANERISE